MSDSCFKTHALGNAKSLKYKIVKENDGSTLVRPYVNNPDDELVDYSKYSAPFYNVDPKGTIEIKKSTKGMASIEETTVMKRFETAVQKHGDDIALVSATDEKLTWKQYYENAKCMAKFLIKVGLPAAGSVNIIGFNSPEWLTMNMGAIAAGGKAAGIYTSNGPEACQYITEHSGAVVVACQDKNQLDKFLEIRANLPELKAIVVWEDTELPAGVNDDESVAKVYSWKEAVEIGNSSGLEEELEKRIADQKPGDACTLIYTSGTTGNPKAVMISHDNLNWCSSSLFGCFGDEFGQATDVEGEHIVSYLPLSHIAAQILDIHAPLNCAALLASNATVWFADKMALKGTLLQTLTKARPTTFFGVPRVWEKFSEAMKKSGASNTGLKKKLITWAKEKGSERFTNRQNGGNGEDPWFFFLANVLLKKVRQKIGLDRCKFCFTGAAPIGKETLNFFGALNIPVLELYGMSECTGPHTVCHEFGNGHVVGSTGPPMAGCEMKIFHEQGRDQEGEGEICYRGRHVMMGYMNDEEKTKQAIDNEGWLHSGDIGRVDENGMLYITGRIKELIITAGGENIPPVPIEEDIKMRVPAVSNFVMIGDKRKFNTALVTLKTEPNADGTFSNKLAGEALAVNPKVKTVEEAQNDEKWKKYIQGGIDGYNNNAISNATKIQYFTILDKDFSVPGGELGPTLKLKRPVVTKLYADQIEAMYNK